MTSPDPPPGVLEQYGLAVEMADRVSARRATANSFFLTVQTALVALFAIDGIERRWIAAAGVVLAVGWFLLLRSYRTLSAAKWQVILALEAALPVQPFTDEWTLLRRRAGGRAWAVHREIGFVERIVPLVFAAVFVVALLSL
jgi:hypothetical protein